MSQEERDGKAGDELPPAFIDSRLDEHGFRNIAEVNKGNVFEIPNLAVAILLVARNGVLTLQLSLHRRRRYTGVEIVPIHY